MKRLITALTAITFVVALGGAATVQPAQSAAKKAAKSAQTKTSKSSKGSARTGNDPVLLHRLAMRSTCRNDGVKRGLSGPPLWEYVNSCVGS